MGTVRGSALAEGSEPSLFQFMTVEGTRLRYFDWGSGIPVVLLHGNGSMMEDFLSSGIIELGTPGHRFIAIDRPGFGHSERPQDRAWGPSEQARLVSQVCARLGAERPVVVGHSWGALVALALALDRPQDVAGLVLLSGYYYPIPRAGRITVAPSAFPIVNDLVRLTVEPYMRRLMAPGAVRHVFAPCAVPERFKRAYSIPLALRPSQTRAVAEEAAMLVQAAATLSACYGDLRVPVRLIAGADDRVVDTAEHSGRLHRELGAGTFRRVPECGHMVHHAAPMEVIAAIGEVGQLRAGETLALAAAAMRASPRRWLHIGERLVAA